MTMHILWIQWRDIKNPLAGGAEVYAHEICRRLVRKGVKILYVSSWMPGLKTLEEIDGYQVIRVGTHNDFILHIPRILNRYADWADLIVEDTSKVPLMLPLLHSNKKPVLAIVHHLNREIYFYELPYRKAIIAYIIESVMPKLYTNLPNVRFIAVSRSTKEELIKLGVKPDKIYIVPNGVDKEKQNYCNNVKDSDPTILYLSRYKTYKQPFHAILAFTKVLKNIPNTKLIIAGKNTEILSKYVYKFNLNNSVKLYGEVSEIKKMELLSRSWLLIQTSLKEGFGLTVLEAALCRTPTVAYDVAGFRDSVKHMETGLLVKPGDVEGLAKAIITLLTDTDLWKKLSENAFRYAQNFDWDKTAEAFLKILKEVERN